MDYGVVLNSFFWRRFRNQETITFFDPNEVPDLYEAFYRNTELFEKLYCHYEQRTDLKKKVMSADEVFRGGILKERTDTGRIYLVYIDNVQNQGPFDTDYHTIYQSNLCCEILLPTQSFKSLDDEGEFKLTLDNGQEISLTGQHKVLLKDGSKKKVRELSENDDIDDLLL
jgi:ribonucleoside-diphosphate reductase alpha chain